MRNLIAVLLMLALSGLSYAQSAAPTLEFSWTLPATLEGGAPITRDSLSTVQLYDATTKAKLATWLVGATGNAGVYTSTQGGERKYYATVTSKTGLESDPSNIVVVDMRRPDKLSNLQVKVVFTATGR